MHFAFTAQQLEFRDAVRQVLAKECTPADLRAAYARRRPGRPGGPPWPSSAWSGCTLPETHGGLGLGLVDLVPVLEEVGRVALPEPLAGDHGPGRPLLAGLDGRSPADGSLLLRL